VVIHHPANGIGIFAKRADNIIIENVEVIAYGNEWGAQPCPTAWPTAGVNCNNISIFDSLNVWIHSVKVENGSKGIAVTRSEGASLTKVVAKNVRGPFPGGQCFQIGSSDYSLIEDFYCFNDLEISWP
jgi:pectate lyase